MKKTSNSASPTQEAYAELQMAYDHFNHALFAGELPPCLITLQRERRTLGYFSEQRFVSHDRVVTDEIAMNPSYFAVCGIEDSLSTLVHEMAHLWQHHYGKPGRARYHNREWAEKMVSLGLTPSDTGQPGGKMTGDSMSHLIDAGGPFQKSCAKLLDRQFRLSWLDRFPPADTLHEGATDLADMMDMPDPSKPKNKSKRVKYQCPNCSSQAWGKPGLMLLCGVPECNARSMNPVL